ncbi:SDR family oxidoreductase [Sulfuriferula sp.]|uniref:SDR family NAD(P)-dependent oxidoreductase n=1 Tax=Sulfuriferula sp. TaxID=2025307 RepID=UPI0027300450|nr:SDR family NAD(P)-dependent oxidoreductase [Sulfuriferula sp.]MDP2025014.1 SDR family NAD(P)-dependent oxidoreductase [Sulfuriferula sp.]
MRALVVGASAGVGRALCEVLGARGSALMLVASDARDLDALAAHLRLVYRVEVQTVAADATRVTEFVEQVGKAAAAFGAIDSLYFPIGASRAEDRGLLGMEQASAILNSNLTVVIGLTSRFLPQLLELPQARIVGFSSIAAIRGRKANVVYSAAKRGLESYFESLRHLTAATGVRVQLYRLGYVATQQSFGQRLLFPVVTPQQVAQEVLRNLDKDIGKVFFPRYWALIALAVSWVPWPIYKKLDF